MAPDTNDGNRTGGNGSPRIGVYLCHCGTNIGGTVNIKDVAEYVSTLPGVVLAKDYKYECSDPGQALIKRDIKEHRLERLVVAACSPSLHETTFRTVASEAGMNPYYFQMVNIREHNAWVHHDKDKATDKAKDLIRAAVHRVKWHKPLKRRRVAINADVRIVGGGIAGITSALTLANAGKKVYLVEKEPSIGGRMAQLDKTFPTLDCSACILTPKMTDVKAHPNITMWTYSDVTGVDGFVGNFEVKIERKPRYIIEDLCVGCYECIEACVFKKGKFRSEFDEGMSLRKPIYIPFPQGVPLVPVIDPTTCLQFKIGRCKQTCVDACGDRGAVDLKQEATHETIEVGTIILATGYKPFNPTRLPQYGYGTYPNVYTALEVERLINASGPTGGEIVLRDGRKPKRVGIIHCIGSRDKNTNTYCSRVCCMYSLKLAHLILEKTGAEVYNFYIDIRTPGKGFEEFYNRVADEGARMIRGKVANVYQEPESDGDMVLEVEDTLAGVYRNIPVDMVILATGLEAQDDAEDVRRMFNITCSDTGFFMERHPKLAPVNTLSDGIFLAGCCQGPRDIPDTVAQAGAAAAEAMALIDRQYIELEPNTARVLEDNCSGCKNCIGLCPYLAITFDDETKKAVINEVLCKGCGTCVASCPSGSIEQDLFEDNQIFEEIGGLLNYE